MPVPTLVLVAAALLFLVMAAVWAVAVRIRNAGIVDIAWSANFSLLAALYAGLGPGFLPRRLLIGGMTLLWSLRLAGYLYRRVMGHHRGVEMRSPLPDGSAPGNSTPLPAEDGRYLQLRREWAPHVDRRFFWFFQAQAGLNLLLGAPLLLACANPAPRIHALEWAGLGVWAVALAGEAAADRQLVAFRSDPASRGKTCRTGLWRYSRHPNYFFEWLVWVAYFVFALASPWGWATALCPAVMLFFLFRVTGIPMTEEQALKSRGDDYREYQRTTSAFFPWFPRT